MSRLRQSIDEFEQAYVAEVFEDRRRADAARRRTEQRVRTRQAQRRHQRGTQRFFLLVLAIIVTAVVVTIAMFRMLYAVMG
jgi:hypothetical protein